MFNSWNAVNCQEIWSRVFWLTHWGLEKKCRHHDDVIKWKHFPRHSPVTGEFPSQRPVTRSFGVFFDLDLNKRLSKPSRRRWFETPSPLLWRHSNVCILRSQMQFFDTKLLCFDLIVIELRSYWGNWYQVSIGSGNGLAPHRLEAMTRPPRVHCDLTNKMPQGTLQKTYLSTKLCGVMILPVDGLTPLASVESRLHMGKIT